MPFIIIYGLVPFVYTKFTKCKILPKASISSISRSYTILKKNIPNSSCAVNFHIITKNKIIGKNIQEVHTSEVRLNYLFLVSIALLVRTIHPVTHHSELADLIHLLRVHSQLQPKNIRNLNIVNFAI